MRHQNHNQKFSMTSSNRSNANNSKTKTDFSTAGIKATRSASRYGKNQQQQMMISSTRTTQNNHRSRPHEDEYQDEMVN